MSTSSSANYTSVFAVPVASLQYRDIGGHSISDGLQPLGLDPLMSGDGGRPEVEMTEAELETRIRQERAEAAQQTEQKLRQEYEQKLMVARTPIAAAIANFMQQRDEYFARVESEIVQLSLSIAAKILHRESQVDPMLVASLVRIAIEKIREESSVTVRVSPGRAAGWKSWFAAQPNMARVEVVSDPQLNDQDCVVETELGSANFGLDTQLKEVERGFFDLLALRPTNR